ncbi:MAG: hypothetical protein A2600_12810 [Candidatus Lambdaproteobacteria bacterium RIFOXYD1_FULL_56_27]|uniref:Guanylate cyclase domain-containing protein n=1 Tax=Candidatus Lambdaproteobacteria bacterium RIFOXYD2_FULL_56_26 TaxID=1817773 RepID=A0A1F6GW60_9PROT|nr:MAG: hypothetical protein A2557_05445 [Candidatus Lambdaproteobacteria bacterium RIFOXYD2_FULL_56_26]OGH07549.1 MAG: hypothetical protein A2600_12810 [Candidatus Lambdaproteobacteria bacterium RIFOXYD1_FULL_56_27]
MSKESKEFIHVALLDILGYRSLIKADMEGGSDFGFRKKLTNALQALSGMNEAEFSFQSISDTIILAQSADDLLKLLWILKNVYVAFIGQGLLIRGALVFEQHFKNNHLTYSNALVLAQDKEKNAAVYPRIVIDSGVVEREREHENWQRIIDSKLVYAQGGQYFLNVLDKGNWGQVYESAKLIYGAFFEGKLGDKSEHVLLKHLWLENYLISSEHADSQFGRYIQPLRPLE